MDRRTDWPWSSEEEAEWKTELEERDYDFLEELIDSAVDNSIPSSLYVLGPRDVEESVDAAPDKYLVAA